jgi:hypothetical protein
MPRKMTVAEKVKGDQAKGSPALDCLLARKMEAKPQRRLPSVKRVGRTEIFRWGGLFREGARVEVGLMGCWVRLWVSKKKPIILF